MGYTISGNYLADCSCDQVCPCPVDGRPNAPDGQCWGAAVFHIEQGSLGDVDLSGVDFGLVNNFPSNLSAGNWTMGVIVDESISEEQAGAVERILSGQEGGPFAEFAPLIGKFTGVSRAKVSFSNGGSPSASIGGVGDFAITPHAGPGGPVTVKNAPFAFAPEYTIGLASGSGEVLGKSVEFKYAETAHFEYSSEGEGQTARA